MSEDTVLLRKEGSFAWITINRPKSLNAINSEVTKKLGEVVRELRDAIDIKVVIVTGAGEKAFVAGADIMEMHNITSLEAKALSARMQQVLDELAALPQPSIAAINGFALGGGCELAMACDLRIAADTAKLGVPEVALGVFPGAGGTQRLPRLVGPARAKYLVLTGEVISAEESERIGLVNKVVPKDKLVEEVTALAQKLAAQGPQAVRLAKQSIDGGAGMDLKSAQALENSLFALTFGDEQKEGMSAFIEKRKPNF